MLISWWGLPASFLPRARGAWIGGTLPLQNKGLSLFPAFIPAFSSFLYFLLLFLLASPFSWPPLWIIYCFCKFQKSIPSLQVWFYTHSPLYIDSHINPAQQALSNINQIYTPFFNKFLVTFLYSSNALWLHQHYQVTPYLSRPDLSCLTYNASSLLDSLLILSQC